MNALDIAESIAERLERTQDSGGFTNFASGAAGNALLFLALAQTRSSERWARAAHRSIRAAATAGQATLAGLFTGLAGLLFVTAYAARIDARYASLRDQCARALANSGAASPALRHVERAKEYDLISGAAGIHAALVYAGCFDEARGTRAYLEWLLEDENRWASTHELDAENGRANDLGVAHGLAGILAVLSSDEAADATRMERAVERLWEWRIPETCLWPASTGRFRRQATRAAWCYGNPGIAMAFLGASRRTRAFERYAREALLAILDQPRDSWGQVDYALCHGAAGNGLIFALAASQLDDGGLASCAERLIEDLRDVYDEAHPFGYRNWDNIRNCWVDDPSLMTGAAGIALTLVTLYGNADASWTASFALPQTLRRTTGTAS